jgi:hypothetical protein
MGSTVSIVIAVVAVVVGFLVLKNINDSDSGTASGADPDITVPTGGSGDPADSSTSSSVDAGPTTTAGLNTDPAQQVIVANASGLGGAAGRYTTALAGVGFTTGTPTDATSQVDVSVVYYLPGGEAVAASVATAMGAPDSGVSAQPMPAVVPITGAVMPAGATVLVMLGTDRADKALPIAAGTTATTLTPSPIDQSTTTVAG